MFQMAMKHEPFRTPLISRASRCSTALNPAGSVSGAVLSDPAPPAAAPDRGRSPPSGLTLEEMSAMALMSSVAAMRMSEKREIAIGRKGREAGRLVSSDSALAYGAV